MKAFKIIILFLVAMVGCGYVVYSRVNKASAQTNTLSLLNPITKTKSIFSFFLHKEVKPKKIIFGYLPYWSVNKIQYMQLDKLTDIAYFGLYLNEDGTFKTKFEDGTAESGYEAWHNDKDLADFISFAQKSGVRISLTVISHEDEISDKFLDCEECKVALLENLKQEMDLHNVKDLNMNFEYVEFTEPEYSEKYTKLVEYLNTELDKTYGNSYVTVATFADSFVKPRVTNVESLGKIADGLFIMAYDFHHPNSDNAGPVAPLDGIGVHASYDINTMINDYLKVVPPNKIILGVPYYGYNWIVEDEEQMSKRIPGDEDIGKSQSQAYSDIMDTIIELNPLIQWDELGKVPYFTYKSPETGMLRQVYYENEESLKLKYKVAEQLNLGGIGIWALGYDGGYVELWDLLASEFLN